MPNNLPPLPQGYKFEDESKQGSSSSSMPPLPKGYTFEVDPQSAPTQASHQPSAKPQPLEPTPDMSAVASHKRQPSLFQQQAAPQSKAAPLEQTPFDFKPPSREPVDTRAGMRPPAPRATTVDEYRQLRQQGEHLKSADSSPLDYLITMGKDIATTPYESTLYYLDQYNPGREDHPLKKPAKMWASGVDKVAEAVMPDKAISDVTTMPSWVRERPWLAGGYAFNRGVIRDTPRVVAKKVGEFVLDPINALFMYVGGPGASQVRPLMAAAADAFFMGMMGKGLYDNVMGIGQDVKEGKWNEAAEKMGDASVDLYFMSHGAKGLKERLRLARELHSYNEHAQEKYGKKWYELDQKQKADVVFGAIRNKTTAEMAKIIKDAGGLGMRGLKPRDFQRTAAGPVFDRARMLLNRARKGEMGRDEWEQGTRLPQPWAEGKAGNVLLLDEAEQRIMRDRVARAEQRQSEEHFQKLQSEWSAERETIRKQAEEEAAWTTIQAERFRTQQEPDSRVSMPEPEAIVYSTGKPSNPLLAAKLGKAIENISGPQGTMARLHEEAQAQMYVDAHDQAQSLREKNKGQWTALEHEFMDQYESASKKPTFELPDKPELSVDPKQRRTALKKGLDAITQQGSLSVEELAAYERGENVEAVEQKAQAAAEAAQRFLGDYSDEDLMGLMSEANRKALDAGTEVSPYHDNGMPDWAAQEFTRRQKAFWAELEDIERMADLRDASSAFSEASGKAQTPEEAEALAKLAEEAHNRAEGVQNDLDARKVARVAQTIELQSFPVDAPVKELARGRGTVVFLPDKTKLEAHYALMKLGDLVISHDPLDNYAKNPDFIWDEGMEKSPAQDRDYLTSKELQAAVEADAANLEPGMIFTTAADGTTGPSVMREDGKVLGGNGRTMRLIVATTKHNKGKLIRDAVAARAADFGLDPKTVPEFPDGSKWRDLPVVVRVLHDAIEQREDLLHVGINLNRDMTMGKSSAETSVSIAELLTPDFMDWVSAAFEQLPDDASFTEFANANAKTIVDKMVALGIIPANKTAEYIASSGEMTARAQNLFKEAARGKVIRNASVLATTPEGVLKKIDRSLGPLFRLVANGGKWDISDYLTDALGWWKDVDAARDSLRNVGKSGDSLVDRWLHPENYGRGTGYMTERQMPHPVTEALMKLLESSGLEIKRALLPYAGDAEGLQMTLGAVEPPLPYQSFNEHIGSKVGIKVTPEQWVTVEKPKRNKIERKPVAPSEHEVAADAVAKAEAAIENAGLEVVGTDGDTVHFRDPKNPSVVASGSAAEVAQEGAPERLLRDRRSTAPVPPAGPEREGGVSGEGPATVGASRASSTGTPPPDLAPTMSEAGIRSALESHGGYNIAQVDTMVGVWKRLVEGVIGHDFDEFLKKTFAKITVGGEFKPEDVEGNSLDQASRVIMGEGMEPSQIDSWTKRQGGNIRFEPYGEQGSLFGASEPMFRLWNKDSKESLIVTERQFERLKELNPSLGRQSEQGQLFSSGQEGILFQAAPAAALREPAEFKGKAFFTGAVNPLDGQIEAVVDHRAAAQFRHNGYFPPEIAARIDRGELATFVVENGRVALHRTVESGMPAAGLVRAIEGQIEIRPRPVFFQEKETPTWFLKSEALLKDPKAMVAGSGEQWLAYLKNKGIKEDELKWTGLEDFLKGNKKVTREEVQQHLAENQVQVQEVVLGESPYQKAFEKVTKQRDDAYAEVMTTGFKAGLNHDGVELLTGDIRNQYVTRAGLEAVKDELRGYLGQRADANYPLTSEQVALAEAVNKAVHFTDEYERRARFINAEKQEGKASKYEMHTLPGEKKYYTELLLTLPGKPLPKGDWEYQVRARVQKALEDLHYEDSRIVADLVRRYTLKQMGTPVEMPEAEQRTAREAIDRLKTEGHGELYTEYLRGMDKSVAHGEKTRATYLTSHFGGIPNILAHIRLDERIGADGKPLLLVEEVQSDWHQEGKKKGYKSAVEKDAFRQQYPGYELNGVPDAPFKSDWHELAMRRMLRYAVEHGYDRIAWVTGEQTQQRYDLSRHLDNLAFKKSENGEFYDIQGEKDGRIEYRQNRVSAAALEGLVGKDIARRIVESEEKPDAYGWSTLTGESLKIGGKWAENLYDKAIPNFLNKYTKKWGGKVGETRIVAGDEVTRKVDVRSPGGTVLWTGDTREGAENWLKYNGKQPYAIGATIHEGEFGGEKVHSLEITPEMKRSVREGQPLFQADKLPTVKKGMTQFLEDGRAIMRLYESADVTTFFHEMMHTVRPYLPKSDLAVLEDWLGVIDGAWKPKHEEKLARAYERYWWDGIAPNQKLKMLFAKVAKWMHESYRTVKGSPIDIKIPDHIRALFDKWHSADGRAKEAVALEPRPDGPVKPSNAGAKREVPADMSAGNSTPAENFAAPQEKPAPVSGGLEPTPDQADVEADAVPQPKSKWKQTSGFGDTVELPDGRRGIVVGHWGETGLKVAVQGKSKGKSVDHEITDQSKVKQIAKGLAQWSPSNVEADLKAAQNRLEPAPEPYNPTVSDAAKAMNSPATLSPEVANAVLKEFGEGADRLLQRAHKDYIVTPGNERDMLAIARTIRKLDGEKSNSTAALAEAIQYVSPGESLYQLAHKPKLPENKSDHPIIDRAKQVYQAMHPEEQGSLVGSGNGAADPRLGERGNGEKAYYDLSLKEYAALPDAGKVPKSSILSLRDEQWGDAKELAKWGRDQLSTAAYFWGVPRSGSKDVVIKNIVDRWKLRGRLSDETAENLQKLKTPELKKLAAEAGVFHSNGNKESIAKSLIGWRDSERKRAQWELAKGRHEVWVRRALAAGRTVNPENLEKYNMLPNGNPAPFVMGVALPHLENHYPDVVKAAREMDPEAFKQWFTEQQKNGMSKASFLSMDITGVGYMPEVLQRQIKLADEEMAGGQLFAPASLDAKPKEEPSLAKLEPTPDAKPSKKNLANEPAPKGFMRLGDGTLTDAKEEENIFPSPVKKHDAVDMTNGEVLTPEQAKARLEEWKAYADNLGKTQDNSNKVIISLFDRTGVMAEPWRRAGYDVRQYDSELGDDLLEYMPVADILKMKEDGKEIYGVIAQPPCTSYASSGAQWWADQHDKANVEMVEEKYGWRASRSFDTPVEYADTLVAVAEQVIALANPKGFHVMENPIGRIKERMDLPDPLLVFDPHHFGDPYTKRTQFWGDFNPELPTANVEPTKGSAVHKMSSGDARRSETPEGVSYAFFMANHEGVAKESKTWPRPRSEKALEPTPAAEQAGLFGEESGEKPKFKLPGEGALSPKQLHYITEGRSTGLPVDWPVTVDGKKGVINGWKWGGEYGGGAGLDAYYIKFDGEKKDKTVRPDQVMPLRPADDYNPHGNMQFLAYQVGPQFVISEINADTITFEDGVTGKTYTVNKWESLHRQELDEKVAADRRKLKSVEWNAGQQKLVVLNGGLEPTPEQERLLPKEEAQRLPDNVLAFGSGASKPADMRGQYEAGMPIGVSVADLSRKGIDQLAKYAAEGHAIFLDSGAFSEIEFGPDGAPKVVKEISDDEWRRRLGIYDEIARAAGGEGEVHLVAPDMVGSQERTLERVEKFADELQNLAGLGANIIVPMQGGSLPATQFFKMAQEAAGIDLVPGFPMNKAAASGEEILQFLRENPDVGFIHLLGMGPTDSGAKQLLTAIRSEFPKVWVTMDSNRLRAKTDAISETSNLVREQKMEGWSGEVDVADGVRDYTEEVYSPSKWASKKELKRIADELGKLSEGYTEFDRKAFIQDPDSMVEELSEQFGDYFDQILTDGYLKSLEKDVRSAARSEAVKGAMEGELPSSGGKKKAEAVAKSIELTPDQLEDAEMIADGGDDMTPLMDKAKQKEFANKDEAFQWGIDNQESIRALRMYELPDGRIFAHFVPKDGKVLFQEATSQSEQFNKWFRDSKVVDEDGAPKVLYHGTTHDFTKFDTKNGTVESHLGKAFYFTEDPKDASKQYATPEGPDIANRIEREVEHILEAREPYQPWNTNSPEYAETLERVTKEMTGPHQGAVMPVYVRMRKPLVLEKNGGTWFNLNFNERTETESGSALKLYKAVQKVAREHDVDGEKIWAEVMESIESPEKFGEYRGGNEKYPSYDISDFPAHAFDRALRQSDALLEHTDEKGDILQTDFIRQVYDAAGFDGVIMNADENWGPSAKWGKMDMARGTKHYIVWNPRQIKSLFNRGSFNARSSNILFQESAPDVERKIAMVKDRLGMKLLPVAERNKLEGMLKSLEAQKAQRPLPGVKPEVKSKLEPRPDAKPAATRPVIHLWTPTGGVKPKEVTSGTPTDRTGAAVDAPAPHGQPRGTERVPEQPRPAAGSGAERPAGRGVRAGEPAGKGKRGKPGDEGAGRLPDVAPARIDAPKRPRGTPIYEAEAWKATAKKYKLPEGIPAPTVSISPFTRRMLMFPGQPEVAELALSSLQQYDSTIIATATGSGKTYLGAGVLHEMLEGKLGEKPRNVLILTTSQTLIENPDNTGWKDIAMDFDVDIQKLPPGESTPSEPGVYITTYATAIGRQGIQDFHWDAVFADEIGEARRWYASQRGAMMKDLATNAGKVVYLSATPFHTALELGHMDKLGLWDSEGFEAWGKQFGIFRDEDGNWAGGNAPKKLIKLREQLVERGQYIEIPRNMEGYTSTFVQVPMTGKLRQKISDATQAFGMAEDYFQRVGKRALMRAVRGNRVTYLKNLLERERLPEVIEFGKKLESEGWKVVLFSENKKEVDAPYDFMMEADEAMGGEISRLLPKLPNVVTELEAAFPGQVANFSGSHSMAREGEKQAFLKNTKKHLYATYGAGGIGVSLHDKRGDRPRAAIYLGPPWSGVMLDQAIGRPWRYGTKSDVQAFFFLSNAKAETDLVLKKVAPRLESLRALVNGIHLTDPMVNAMRKLESSQEGALSYELGNAHDASVNEFSEEVQAPIVTVSEVTVPSAKDAHYKGMRYPGEEGPRGQGPVKLFQMGEADYEPPKDLLLPESEEAERLNEEIRADFAEKGDGPGVNQAAMQAIPKAERLLAADVIASTAAEAATRAPEGAERAVVRREWEAKAKEIETLHKAVQEPGKVSTMFFFTHGREAIRTVCRQAGVPELGVELARMIPEYHVVSGNTAGPFLQRWYGLISDLNKSEIKNLYLAKEGVRPAMNDKVAQALPRFVELTNDIRKAMADAGVAVEVFDGADRRYVKYANIDNDPKYVPHRFNYDEEFTFFKTPDGKWKFMPEEKAAEKGYTETRKFTLREILNDKKLGAARRESIIQTIMDATDKSRAQVEDWLGKRHRDVPLIGNVERAREDDLPFWRTDAMAMAEYIEGVGEVVARKKVFGQRREKVEPLIFKIPSKDARDVTRKVFDSLLQRHSWRDDTKAFVRFAADYAVLSKMTFSAIKVPFHMLHAALFTNTRALLKGILHSTLNWKDVNENAQFAGSIIEQDRVRMMGEMGLNRRLTEKALDLNQFNRSYRVGRTVVSDVARQWMDDYALPSLRKNKKNRNMVMDHLRNVLLLGEDAIDKATENGQWSKEDYARAGKALSDKVMFTFDPTELPPSWRARAEDPIADSVLAAFRVTTLLRSFTYKTAVILRDRIWNEAFGKDAAGNYKLNFRPWIPLLLLYPAAGEVMRDLTALATVNKKKFDELMQDIQQGPLGILRRYLEDWSYATGMHMLGMMFDSHLSPMMKMESAFENVAGVLYSDILRTVIGFPSSLLQAQTDNARYNALKHWLQGTFPVTAPVMRVGETALGYDAVKAKKDAQRELRRRQNQKRKKGGSSYKMEPTPL